MSPIKPEKRGLYSEDWARISKLVRERAGWKCELCRAEQRGPHPITGSEVVLTVHHVNGDPADNRKLNLLALCQRCHNVITKKIEELEIIGKEMQTIRQAKSSTSRSGTRGGVGNYFIKKEKPMTEQTALFPKAHKEVVISMLENYEKETNDRMQKTIDVITKKKDELEIIGREIQTIRQAKKYVEEIAFPESQEAQPDAQ